MNSLFNAVKGAATSALSGEPEKKDSSEPSNTELLASAKVVAEACQATFSNESDKVDKAKVAGAADDLLEAAEKYGKFDEKQGVGQYINQAQEFLHRYETPEKPPTETPPPTEQPPATEQPPPPANTDEKPPEAPAKE